MSAEDYRIAETVGDYNLVCCEGEGKYWLIVCRYCGHVEAGGVYPVVLKFWTAMVGDKIPYHCTKQDA